MDVGVIPYAIVSGVFAAGAAMGGVKAALNGSKKKIDEMHKQLHSHINDEVSADQETHNRITRLETKMDLIISGLLRLKE